ncbi:hypothetical protein chiPu_0033461, partial [Chiloscyllium punctatum]|nr:hypothetical protein [Chiloscyllium punctatum]
MAEPSVAVVEHLRVARRVARPRREKAATLFAALFCGGAALGFGQRVGAAVGGEKRDKIGELLRLKGENLVARLRG